MQSLCKPFRAVLVAAALLAGQEAAPTLRGRTLEEWRARIEPSAEEVAWTEIPWRPSFWSGAQEAQEAHKPLLLWAMNGHPLGCT